MDPSYLNDDEIRYELKIRGINDISDRRAATKALRSDLDKESKGLKEAPNSRNLSPFPANKYLSFVERTVHELVSEVIGAINRGDAHAQNVLNSKCLHYYGKVKRLSGSDASEVQRIEDLLAEINKQLEDIKTNSEKSKVKSRVDHSTGAVPKNNCKNNESLISTVNVLEHEENVGAQSLNPNVDDIFDVRDHEVVETEASQQRNEIAAVNSANENRPLSNNNLLPPIIQNRNEIPRTLQQGLLNQSSSNNSYSWPAPPNQNREEVPRNLLQGVADFDNIINGARNGNPNTPQNHRMSGRELDFLNRRNLDFPPVIANNNRERFSLGTTRPARPIVNEMSFPQNYQANYNPPRDAQRREANQGNLDGRQTNLGQSRRRNPVAEWNVTFSGDSKEVSLNDFLSQVDLLARAERVTEAELLLSAVYLFKGSAYTWYRAFNPYYRTWGELVAGLRSQFLPVDYDFWLLRELEQRRQGDTENFGIFFAAMEMLFRNLSYRLSEQQKLAIVMRNMLPLYAERLALEDFETLPQLAARCKRIEEVKYRVGRQIAPQINRRDLLEPAFSYQPQYHSNARHQRVNEIEHVYDEEPDYVQLAYVSNPVQRTRLCYNCGEPGHQFNQCRSERRLFCYRCGAPDCVTRNCKRCQDKEKGNERASSYNSGRMSSQ